MTSEADTAHGAGARPVLYVPVLKGRPAEFRALTETASSEGLIPLLEVMPPAMEAESEEEGETGPDSDSVVQSVRKFSDRLHKSWAHGTPVIVDAGLFPTTVATPTGPQAAIAYLTSTLASEGHPVWPSVRPSEAPHVVSQIAEVVHANALDGVCIRVAGEDLDDDVTPLAVLLQALLSALELDPSQAVLLLDVGSLPDERAAGFAGRVVRLVLGELPADNWREVVVAGGAFPADLSGIQADVLTGLPRHEVDMWTATRTRQPRVTGFGDYTVAHPAQPPAVGFAAPPQLRWTSGDQWLVMKGRRRDAEGHRQFFDIADRVRALPEFDASLSWGDDFVAHARERGAPGNAMLWRAAGTSHHIAYVVRNLATRDAP